MSFVQDNIDRFNRIHSDYNNIANQIGNLTKRDPENDLKNKIESIGSGTESAANLYLEGRKMVHDLKSRKLARGLTSALKEAGENNAKHMLKNNQLLSDTLDKLTNNTSSAAETREPEVPTAPRPKIPKRDLPAKAFGKEAERFNNRRKQLQDKFDATQSTESQTTDRPAEPQTPAETPSQPTPQPAEAPPSATTQVSTQRARPQIPDSVESTDTDETARSLQEPRQISQSRGRTNNDVPEEESGSAGRSVGGSVAREAETEASSAARTAATTAGLEEAGGALDAIPGLDILGLALGAIGGITSAVAGAVPDKKPEEPDKPPKPIQIGGNFAQTNIQAGGSTA